MLQAKRLCEMYPEQPMPYNVMGVLLAQREDHEAAVDNYRQALDLEPEYVDALNNLGSSLHNLGNYQEAIDCYRKVIQLAGQDADALERLQRCGQLGKISTFIQDQVSGYYCLRQMANVADLVAYIAGLPKA